MHNLIHGSLSSGQQGLWLLHQLDGLSDRYHMPLTFQFDQQIEWSALEAALTAFVQRHDMLHSVFITQDGQPSRQVINAPNVFIQTHDVSGCDESDLKRVVRDLSQQPFDLVAGPLLRAHMLTGAHCGDVLLITIHHIVFDGASLKIMYQELSDLHQAISQSGPALPQPALNYQDYVNWQQNWLNTDEAQACKNFWLERLSGELPQLNIPADQPAAHDQAIRGEYLKFALPDSVVSQFKALANEQGCSEYMVWLLAYFSFLSRYTGQTDQIIGTPSMGRPEARFDELIGYFVNLIPLRCQVDPEATFLQLLDRSKTEIYQAMMHADYPLVELIKALGDPSQRGDQPLFQTSFVWTVATHLQNDQTHALGLRIFPLMHEAGEQDLSLELLTTEDGITCLLKYRSNLYSQDLMQQLQRSWLTFVENLAAEPDSPLKELSLISEQEEDFLLHQLNDTARAYPALCLHHLFEQQAKQQPTAIALEFERHVHTYADLNAQANRLAHHILNHHEPAEQGPVVIGLCLERSVDMVVGVLAILKAGAAYLPIDPHLPSQRIAHMLKECGVKWVLTQTSLQAQTSGAGTQQWLLDDADWLKQLPSPAADPSVIGMTHDALAYVIYTSGSTGQPKGVLQSHRTVVNLVHAQAGKQGLSKPLRTLQFAPLSFDVSIQEMATCWFTGSPMVLISQAQKDQLHQLPDLLRALQIERVFVPPMVLNWLAETLMANQQTLPQLTEMVVAGEALTVSDALRKFLLSQSQSRLWNHYGPTETHVATAALVDVSQAVSAQPIGHVLPNLTAWVLDAHQQPVPLGAVGELYIGGAGLAQGYANQPALTRKRFVPHPYGFSDHERLYQTGDLVRYLADGQLAFIGRLDQQVKIRGFRIELGEIEHQLNQQVGVKAAVVDVWHHEEQTPQLVAYVCPEPKITNELLIPQLKTGIRAHLPEYMRPTHYMMLDKMPLTAHGKVDRKALPKPDLTTMQGRYVPPNGAVAAQLSQIWADLLVIPAAKISAHANFFELGGHSLLVARLINEIKQRLSIELTYQTVFDQNTLQALADQISQQQKSQHLAASLSGAEAVEEMEW